jgi:hypothetical protein
MRELHGNAMRKLHHTAFSGKKMHSLQAAAVRFMQKDTGSEASIAEVT